MEHDSRSTCQKSNELALGVLRVIYIVLKYGTMNTDNERGQMKDWPGGLFHVIHHTDSS